MPSNPLNRTETRQVLIGLAAMLLALLLLPVARAQGAPAASIFAAPSVSSTEQTQPPTARLTTVRVAPPNRIAWRPDAHGNLSLAPSTVIAESPVFDLPAPPEDTLPQASTDAKEEVAAEQIDPTLAFTPAVEGISRRLQPEVRKGFDLGRAGAIYAARTQFITVLRKVALAKDAAEGTERHSVALAEGLRSLDEADDFVPRGDALETELNAWSISRSHSTPVVRLTTEYYLAPHEAIARYSVYAADRLGEAVADEQAGSMALFGLGKSYARLAAQAETPTARRKSAVMYRAAIEASEQNYLAANELGVYLARSGRYAQAGHVLRQAAKNNEAPASVHENLALVQQRLGDTEGANTTLNKVQHVAQAEAATGATSNRFGVTWVDPAAFSRGTVATNQPGLASPGPQPESARSPMQAAPEPSSAKGWSGWLARAKRATGWDREPKPQPVVWAPASGGRPVLNHAGQLATTPTAQRVLQ